MTAQNSIIWVYHNVFLQLLIDGETFRLQTASNLRFVYLSLHSG